MKKGRLKKAIGISLIFLGILTVAYPWVKETYYVSQQKRIMEAIVRDFETPAPQSMGGHGLGVNNTPANLAPEKSAYTAEYISNYTEGILGIDKINLRIPILKGATKANLNISAASIVGTGEAGQAGNYCISAHRSRYFGHQFNRLDELAVGDSVEIVQKDVTYRYEVVDKFLAALDDTWVMLPANGQKLLTLITCDYRDKPLPRLIVRAKLLED